jgi:hypothetical protein
LQLKQNEKYKELNNTTNANGSSSSNWQITNAGHIFRRRKKDTCLWNLLQQLHYPVGDENNVDQSAHLHSIKDKECTRFRSKE